MKIAVFHNVPPGGAKRTILEELKYLSKRHIVDLYEISPIHPSVMELSHYCNKNINISFSVKNTLPGILNRLFKDFKVYINLRFIHKSIAKMINNGGYDIALVHPDGYIEAPYLLKYIKIPSIYFCHEPLRIAYDKRFIFNKKVAYYKYIYEIFIRKLKKYSDFQNVKSADMIITASNFVKESVKIYYKRNSTLCYLGVDNIIFHQYKNKSNQLLFIGNKNKFEGYDLAINILNILNKSYVFKLKVLDFKNQRSNISDDNNLAKEYSKSLVTLCLDYGEPFGLKAIESMACGTPVIAVNEGGYKESVIDGVTGYLLARDPKLFSDKITLLYKNIKLYKKMSNDCVSYVEKNWSWEKHGRDLVKYMKVCVRKK